MDYRDLGRAGIKVSHLCLGHMNFGGSADEKASRSIMDHIKVVAVQQSHDQRRCK